MEGGPDGPRADGMRILMVNLSYAPDEIGGAEVVLRTLSHLLAGRGCHVSVLCLSSRGKDWEYDDDGVRVRFLHAHPMGNQMMNPNRKLPHKVLWQALAEYRGWSSRKVAHVIERERPDVVNTHNLLGLSLSAWTAARAAGIPLVHTLHGPSLLCPFGTMLRSDRSCEGQCTGCRLATTRQRLSSVLPDTVIANSAFTLECHTRADYFPSARKHVIPNAPAAPGRSPRPRGTTVPGSPVRIGFLGRLLPYKGVDLLLDALGRLPPEGWTSKIAGTGTPDYVRELRKRAEGLAPQVELSGWTSQDDFFDEIDVLVIPSLIAEPQGMGALEATCRGVPVVYADHGGLRELAGTVGGAVPFPANSVDDLARVLARLIENPAELEALRRDAAIPNVLCSSDRFANAYLAAYGEALPHRAGQPDAGTAAPGPVWPGSRP